ncbi:MAG: hypothetical protein U0792_06810 [Gemmataceae bacterium]
MDAHWWQLPGPGRFVRDVLADLGSGRNVLLRFPSHAAGGCRESVAARVRDNELWRWRPLDASELTAATLAELTMALFRCLRCEPTAGQLPSPAGLAAAVPDGDVIWVDHLDIDRWPLWSKLLGLFQHACHARDENRRGLFCIPLVGRLASEPTPDTALRVHRWSGSVSRLDVMLHLDRQTPHTFPGRLLRQVALGVATELGGADACLCTKLATAGLRLLADPVALLEEHARERGWTAIVARDARWGDGVCENLDGEDRVNSAALAVAGDSGAIKRRVWHGQIRLLYPFIEEQRVKLVSEVGGLLQLPVETTYGPVDKAIDLEIGQLVHFLRSRRVPDRTWRRLLLLRDMRHALAHLEPVEFRTLMSEEFRFLDQSG